jgi:hypothetical protein
VTEIQDVRACWRIRANDIARLRTKRDDKLAMVFMVSEMIP